MKRISVFLIFIVSVLMIPVVALGQDCPSYLVEVNGVCVDPMTDEEYCGVQAGDPFSGEVCADGEVCIDGVCVLTCPSPQVPCNGLCADLFRDEENCGQCGIVCPDGSICENGNCVPCAPVRSESFTWGMIKTRYR